MFRSFQWYFLVVLLAAAGASLPRIARAQAVLPRAGQSFSFGIIEGAYSLPDSVLYLQQTSLTLTVVSAYSGCGIVTSPSGYTQDFSFAPGAPTIIDLPLNLMHLNDLGKTEKGLLVHTTAPVNLVFHDYLPYAGDASQILPDLALDTSYVTCGWGIWDDPSDSEHDLEEFIVTASADSTFVTITPSVRTMLNQQDSVPFTVMLNRGECYIVKADTSDHPSDPSLSGSTVHSTKPVSVISGLTCAYVPVAVEACNELMDELIGKKWWGSHFFVQPLDRNDSGGEIVLTSSNDFVAKLNGNSINSLHGRIATQFVGTLEIHTVDAQNNPFPVELHQLTRSYSYCDSGYGDPSLVTVLDTTYYSDTALWNTPSFFFSHSVPIVCPTADLGIATLDGKALNQLGVPTTVINGSSFSALNPPVRSGVHEIISPVPVFAVPSGFYDADAYTFVAGTAGAELPRDTVDHSLILQADSAMTCSEFNVTASLNTPIQTSEGVITFTITIDYDPKTLHLLAINPLALLQNASFTVDTSIAGTVTIKIIGKPLITGSNLFQLVFEAWKSTAATTVALNSGATTLCGDDTEFVSSNPAIFAVHPSPDTLRRQFLIANTNAVLCQPFTVTISTDSLVQPTDELVLSEIVVSFNPATEQFQGVTPANLIGSHGFVVNLQTPGEMKMILTPATQVVGGKSVILIKFTPQMVVASDTIRAQIYFLHCGDTFSRSLIITFPIAQNIALVSPLALLFDTIVTCLPHDTGIVIWDSSCLPLTLTSVTFTGTDWTVLSGRANRCRFPRSFKVMMAYPFLFGSILR